MTDLQREERRLGFRTVTLTFPSLSSLNSAHQYSHTHKTHSLLHSTPSLDPKRKQKDNSLPFAYNTTPPPPPHTQGILTPPLLHSFTRDPMPTPLPPRLQSPSSITAPSAITAPLRHQTPITCPQQITGIPSNYTSPDYSSIRLQHPPPHTILAPHS